MRVLSIDVGIKNLAYCILEKKSDCKYPEIVEWDIINLCETHPLCNFPVKDKLCDKKASFYIGDKFYCKTHAKKTNLFISKDIPSLTTLKKIPLPELQYLAQVYKLECSSRNIIAGTLYKYYCNHKLNDIIVKGANEMSLIEIAIALNNKLETLKLDDIDHILIENQIATIASRMKCIQSMLIQYFTMKNHDSIQLVSASNKLKYINGIKSEYKDRKKLAITVVNNYLNTVQVSMLPTFINHSKKDDLADTFLQATWYLIDQKLMDNIFLFADYLK